METTKPDKTRQLSQEQENAIEFLLQGQSDRAVAEAVGVTRQTIWGWRHNDILFIATLNQRRQYIWNESKERLKNLAGQALDTIERSLKSGDPKIELAAAQCILKRVLGDVSLGIGPTTPEALIYQREKAKASAEVRSKDPLALDFQIDSQIEALAEKRTKMALKEYGFDSLEKADQVIPQVYMKP